jgi:hypothetical protein
LNLDEELLYSKTSLSDIYAGSSTISHNPATDYITIDNISSDVITIVDIHGKELMQIDNHFKNKLTIDISKLAPSVYFVKIGARAAKFIKIK